ncbi:MAG: glycosyltransferase family 2 protein [Anaerovoracaceae bacterium]
MLISICIPCYKAEHNLPKVIEEVIGEFEKHPEYDYEFVLVNDGSPDDTFGTIHKLCTENDKIVGINFSKNQGQPSARLAAANNAKGDALVFMDDDGQHPAWGIFKLIEKIKEGYDVVYAKFPERKHSFFKKITSKIYNKLMQLTGTKPKSVSTSSFAAWSKISMNAIRDYHSPFPSAGGYLQCVTDKFANVEVEHRARIGGKTGYNLRKMVLQALNAFTNFSMVPLRTASVFGIICAFAGFIGGIYVIIRKLLFPELLAGWASTFSLLLFIGGMLMMVMGLMGEYIGRMYMTISNKPQYIISQIVNGEEIKIYERKKT